MQSKVKRGDILPKTIKGNDDDTAALEHPDHVSAVSLRLTDPQLGKVVTVMEEPFPDLFMVAHISD